MLAVINIQSCMFNPRFHKVNNVDEAVELANNLKEKSGYDLFRGQIKNWPQNHRLSDR